MIVWELCFNRFLCDDTMDVAFGCRFLYSVTSGTSVNIIMLCYLFVKFHFGDKMLSIIYRMIYGLLWMTMFLVTGGVRLQLSWVTQSQVKIIDKSLYQLLKIRYSWHILSYFLHGLSGAKHKYINENSHLVGHCSIVVYDGSVSCDIVMSHTHTYCDILLTNFPQNVSKLITWVLPVSSSWLSLVNEIWWLCLVPTSTTRFAV